MMVTLIDFNILSTSEILVFCLFIACFFFQLFVSFFIYLKLVLVKSEDDQIFANPITTMIVVRNEEERIRGLVQDLLSQKYSQNFIVLIDNSSQDNTTDILDVLKKEIPNLKCTGLSQETRFSDKMLINIGLKASVSNWVLLKDVNFNQMSNKQLFKLNNYIDENTDAVIAYENEGSGDGALLYLFKMERFVQFLLSGSYTLAGLPLVFNENNVLFRKSIYFNVDGFKQRLDRNFANLELIFNEHLKKGKVKVTIEPETIIRNQSEIYWQDYKRLLKKFVLLRKNLKLGRRLLIFFDDWSRLLLFVLMGLLLILSPSNWLLFTVPVFIYLAVMLLIVKKILRRLNEKKIFLPSFIYLLIKPLVNFWLVGSMYLIQRRNKWN